LAVLYEGISAVMNEVYTPAGWGGAADDVRHHAQKGLEKGENPFRSSPAGRRDAGRQIIRPEDRGSTDIKISILYIYFFI
jgi:hypothetical protein